MGIPADSSPFGAQTVTGPGWPNVDEEALSTAAASYEALAAKLTGSVVPLQQSQLMALSENWQGGSGLAAAGEATTIVAGHEANAAQAAAIALKLRAMEVTVAKTKALVNTTAVETQQECQAISAMPFTNTQELVQSRIKLGLSQNIAYVTANSAELAGGLGVPPSIPNPGAPPAEPAAQAAGKGSDQGMQMMGQMAQMAMQLPMQIGGMLAQAPQQMMQPLQQLAQPLQQLMSMGGKGGSDGASVAPFSSFSNHPLAGGAGAGGGAGMVRAASLPGSGGVGLQSPLLANMVGSSAAAVEVSPAGAGTTAIGGLAPMGAGGAGMGGMGMMGARGESAGHASSLGVPAPLEYDLGEDDSDDW